MSSKKIIRLKTPTKIKQSARTPESTFANTHFIELDTITEVHNNEYYQSLHQNLISEINKLYRDIQTIKKEVQQQQTKNINLHQEKNRLKNHIVLLQGQCINYKEMYQLQRHNHLRLRTFYQQRERQWQYIVFEHKRMLEQFDRKHQTSLSKIEQEHQNLQETREEDLEQIKKMQEPQRQQYKKVKRLSAQKNKKPLIQKKPMQPQQAYFVAEINRLYTQEQKFTKKSQLNLLQQSQLKGLTLRNPEIDDLFDRIMRKTYYYFRQKCFTINKMKECQDMIKLKHAKTSTKERLLKTVKKLEFQAQTQSQLATFCQHIEELVLKQQKMLRGDLVFNFIIDKLKQCEKLALTSNSQIEKIELNSLIEGRQLDENQQQQMLDIERISRQNLQLLLNSAIKKPKFSQVSQNIRYSISSLQNLSDLIHGETVGANHQTEPNI